MCLIVVVLRVVIIPYDRILKCCCPNRKTKPVTKRKYTLKTRVVSQLLTVRQARKSFFEQENANGESEGASAEISTFHANETGTPEQSDDEQVENDMYDRRNFRLFAGLYAFAFVTAVLVPITNVMNLTPCETDDVFHIKQGYHDIT